MATEVVSQVQVKSDSRFSINKTRRTSSKAAVQTSIGNPISPVGNCSSSSSDVKFPKIGECAHFHYDTVEYGKLFINIINEPPENGRFNDEDTFTTIFWIRVLCKGSSWVIHRNLRQFSTLDTTLHECVYERRFTKLPVLEDFLNKHQGNEIIQETLEKYVLRLSELPEDQISCAPVLHWLEMDNKGRNLVGGLDDNAAINIPAVAAGHVVRRYTAQNDDELSLEVGDMVSVIDMSDSTWWRGKCRLRVGSFPSQCIRRIADAKEAEEAVPKSPSSENLLNVSSTSKTSAVTANSKPKPIQKKHGKFMEFLRSFLDSRPSKAQLKKSGILKERVFGCDLGEYLHNFKHDIPPVLKDCTEFIEKHGMSDGIYRISGVSSHVQQLRLEYDSENKPDLEKWEGKDGICDPHSVAGLCKLYFRELPNPLLTYQLYHKFAEATQSDMDKRLLHFHDVIQQLPPPHYRTVKHLMLHLNYMAKNDSVTSMHCRNLAIVWAPNLLRSREIEAGIAAFTEARVQSVVTEFLISNADLLFSEKLQSIHYNGAQPSPRPKSLMVLSAPKLISLEEAQARSKSRGKFVRSISTSGAEHCSDFGEITVERSDETSPIEISPTKKEQKFFKANENSSGKFQYRRRKSMDPQISSNNAKWKNRFISSFLRKSQTPNDSIPESEEKLNVVKLRRSWSDDSLLSSHSSIHNLARLNESCDDNFAPSADDDKTRLRSAPVRQSLRPSPRRSPRPRGNIYRDFLKQEGLSGNNQDAKHRPENNWDVLMAEQMKKDAMSTKSENKSAKDEIISGNIAEMMDKSAETNLCEDLGYVTVEKIAPNILVQHEAEVESKQSVDVEINASIVKDSNHVRNPSHDSNEKENIFSENPKNSNDALEDNKFVKKITNDVNENNNNKAIVFNQKNLWKNVDNSKKSKTKIKKENVKESSFYWKNEDIEVPKSTVSTEINKSPDVADVKSYGDYTIHYTPTNQIRNGRTHQSFRATFVKDRQRVMKETPHTILRSYDVPPPNSGKRFNVFQRKSQSQRVKTVSESENSPGLKNSENIKPSRPKNPPLYHSRSMSVDDELTSLHNNIPVPKPRTVSQKFPVPKPRNALKQEVSFVKHYSTPPPQRKVKRSEWKEVTLTRPYKPSNKDSFGDTENKSSGRKMSSNESRIQKHLNSSVKEDTVDCSIMPTDIISPTVLSWV